MLDRLGNYAKVEKRILKEILILEPKLPPQSLLCRLQPITCKQQRMVLHILTDQAAMA